MQPLDLFDIWAPSEGRWSGWAKPVLFAGIRPDAPRDVPAPFIEAIRGLDVSWAPPSKEDVAIIIDLPGAQALTAGLALAFRGYWPVPLYNTTPHEVAIVEVDSIIELLEQGAEALRKADPPQTGPPAFLLDSRRMTGSPAPLKYDNRWMVFPQDFPSATYLLRYQVLDVVVVQERSGQPADDLRHILRRWQEAGIRVSTVQPAPGQKPAVIDVARPSGFRSLWHRMMATFGLRRNSAGGFGAVVPQPSQSSGGLG